MFWHGSDTSDLLDILNVKCLNAAIVQYAPNFHHAFCICCDKCIELRKTIDTDKRMLMAIELHDLLFKIRVPNEDLEIKATTNYDFVLFAICHFTHRLFVAFENFNWLLCEIFSKLFR